MESISLHELEQIFKRVIEKLKSENVDEIELEKDFYRYIPTDKWDSFEADIYESGSLFDDSSSLKLLVNDEERLCTYVDFDRLASVLRAISQIKNPL